MQKNFKLLAIFTAILLTITTVLALSYTNLRKEHTQLVKDYAQVRYISHNDSCTLKTFIHMNNEFLSEILTLREQAKKK